MMSMFSRKILGNISHVFRSTCLGWCPSSARLLTTIMDPKEDFLSLDPQQVKALDELCILVDQNDKPLGPCSKKDCHLMANIQKGMVHRAFSVFLFNSQGELLIQQRSDAKITFPGYFTNTCCSHPLHTPLELEEHDSLGVRRAAQRRLNIELGVPMSQMEPEELTYLTRIQYKASSAGLWGESEIDYILVAQKDVDLQPNPNEIKSLQFISQENLAPFLESLSAQGHKVTPWFQLIANTFLESLWSNLKDLGKLQDHKTIHRL